jgi:hypothetical protein
MQDSRQRADGNLLPGFEVGHRIAKESRGDYGLRFRGYTDIAFLDPLRPLERWKGVSPWDDRRRFYLALLGPERRWKAGLIPLEHHRTAEDQLRRNRTQLTEKTPRKIKLALRRPSLDLPPLERSEEGQRTRRLRKLPFDQTRRIEAAKG